MKPNTFTPFKKFCYTTFGEEKGQEVYNFYKKFFNRTYKHLNYLINYDETDKQKQIESLLERVSQDRFIEILDKFINDWKRGIEKTHHVKYFEACVLNTNELDFTFDNSKERPKVYITDPEPLKKARNDDDDEFYNWIYQCTCCNGTIEPWDRKCPRCSAEVNWKGIDEKLRQLVATVSTK